ncbi:hypothetical protein [Streptomyces sp. NPDC059928]
MPVGGHTSGVEKQPLVGQSPNSVYTKTGKDGTPVQNTIYDENGDAVGHFDFKTTLEPTARMDTSLIHPALLQGAAPTPPIFRRPIFLKAGT